MDPLLNLKLHSSSFAMPASVIWILPAFLIYLTCMTDVTLRSTSGAVFFFFFPFHHEKIHLITLWSFFLSLTTIVCLLFHQTHFLRNFSISQLNLPPQKGRFFPLLKTSLWWLILCVNLTNIITNNKKKYNSIERKFWKTCSINNVRITSWEKVSAFPRWPFWRDSYAVKVSNWVFKAFIFFFTKACIN